MSTKDFACGPRSGVSVVGKIHCKNKTFYECRSLNKKSVVGLRFSVGRPENTWLGPQGLDYKVPGVWGARPHPMPPRAFFGFLRVSEDKKLQTISASRQKNWRFFWSWGGRSPPSLPLDPPLTYANLEPKQALLQFMFLYIFTSISPMGEILERDMTCIRPIYFMTFSGPGLGKMQITAFLYSLYFGSLGN
jgi:hypothetical protein